MNRSKLLVLLVVLLTIGIVFSYQQHIWPFNEKEQEDIPEGTNIGQRAPDFTLENLAGEEVSLSDFRGKKVFLNFWATWCPPCRLEMPDIQKLYNNHEDVVILAVNQREQKGTVSEFLMMNGFDFPILLDQEGKTGTKYLVRGIPTTYTIDEEGVIIGKKTGAMTYEQMLDLLKIE